MNAASRSSSIERWFNAAALAVGETVTRAARVLPRVVRRASGLDDPSPEAVAAGVIRGITTLAPKTMGPVAGTCVDLVGALAVLALATLSVYLDVEDADLCGGMLVGVISLAARRAHAGPSTMAPAWLTASGRMPDRHGLASEAGAFVWWSAGAIERDVIDRLLRAPTRALGPLYVATTALAEAWTAMGEAACLVDGARALARERFGVEEVALEERWKERRDATHAEVVSFVPPLAA